MDGPAWASPKNALSGNLIRNIIVSVVILLVAAIFAYDLTNSSQVASRTSPGLLSPSRDNRELTTTSTTREKGHILCPTSPLADDVVVVFKTGVTEHERVPAHITTDLACPPHIIAGSDVEEDINGFHLEDVLKDIPDSVQDANPSFAFYHQLQELAANDSLDQAAALAHTDGPKEDAPAWQLDKWKFFPLLQMAVQEYPNAKWYIFMEADTYVLWSNMLSLLARYDHRQPVYLGASNFFGSAEYAHGGSGYVLSSTTAHAAAQWIDSNPEKATELVHDNCCGDFVMGLLLKNEVETGLTMAWPSIQGETPATQDYTERHWCVPITSLHHMLPEDVRRMSEFEQGMLGRSSKPILHRDVFGYFVRPKLEARKEGWDNLSEKEESLSERGDAASESFEACQDLCERFDECLQFSWKQGECNTSPVLRLGGESEDEIASGFMVERIESFTTKELGDCPEPQWPGG